MSYFNILHLVLNDYLLFPMMIILVVVMAALSIKGADYLLNLLLLILYISLILFAGYIFEVFLHVNVIFILIFAIFGIAVISILGLKVIVQDGLKGGWKTLKADSFKDK